LDPNYAPAYAELAEVIMLRSDHPTAYGSIPLRQAQAEAEPFARKAVALDPNLGDGYAALGFISLSLDGNSEPYMRKAVELSPQRADFHRWHAETLVALNRYSDAIAEYKRAVEIDPLWGLSYDHLIGALYEIGRRDEARSYAQRFFSLSTDVRAKQLLLLSIHKLDFDLAGELRTAQALFRTYPNDRQVRINLASTLAQIGERRAAAQIMTSDPLARASLNSDWQGLARVADRLGPAFWNQSGWWNMAGLLVASGHSDTIVRSYDRDRPMFAKPGAIRGDDMAMPETIVALRRAGRTADAAHLMAIMREELSRLPNQGLLASEKADGFARLAALSGDRAGALKGLEAWSKRNPLLLSHIPAIALRYDPTFGWLADDPRFAAVEERLRATINTERGKVGLPPITRDAWISDPHTLLTKN
jgi:tetratricopeptide (TPR) repeat protein